MCTNKPELTGPNHILEALRAQQNRTDFMTIQLLLKDAEDVQPRQAANGGPNDQLADQISTAFQKATTP